MLFIRVPTRLHFALCDLGKASPFSVGGIGLGIELPQIEISCGLGSGNVDLFHSALSWKNEIDQILDDLGDCAETKKIDLKVSSSVPAHCGFGSHTALVLGIIEAVGLTLRKDWNESFIVDKSKRGGTSGIGIQPYSRGGLAYDFGRTIAQESLLPSSAIVPETKPLIGPSIAWPEEWSVLLVLPNGKHIYGQEEQKFFETHAPLTEEQALRTISFVHHGIVPAILSQNLAALSTSLLELHAFGFKCAELQNQSNDVIKIYTELIGHDIACGMSSLGPLLYAIVEKRDWRSIEFVEAITKQFGAIAFQQTTASTGREVSYVE